MKSSSAETLSATLVPGEGGQYGGGAQVGDRYIFWRSQGAVLELRDFSLSEDYRPECRRALSLPHPLLSRDSVAVTVRHDMLSVVAVTSCLTVHEALYVRPRRGESFFERGPHRTQSSALPPPQREVHPKACAWCWRGDTWLLALGYNQGQVRHGTTPRDTQFSC
jgi:hypothetical protein